MNYLKVRSYIS